MTEYVHLDRNDHPAILLSKVRNMLEEKECVDLTLASDEGQSIQVHRVIVCAASPYFKELLNQHPSDTHITIILSDVSFELLRAVVEFIYKETVSIRRSQLSALLESATSMKIKGLADAIKCSQQQYGQLETRQVESEGTFLKIVSVETLTQMPSSQIDQEMSWEVNDVFVKEEVNYDSDTTEIYEPEENEWEAFDCSMIGDETPATPIPFKRDPSVEETGEKEQEEKSPEDMQYEESIEHDSDDDTASHYSSHEDVSSTDSSDEDFDIASCSTAAKELKGKATKSSRKTKSVTKEQQKVLPMLTNPKGIFKCGNCANVYKYKGSLTKHQENRCGKEPSFVCKICNHRSAMKSDFKKHLVKIHKMDDSQLAAHGLGPSSRPELPFKCKRCSGSYKTKGFLEAHVRLCGVAPAFECTECDFRAEQKVKLTEHLAVIHRISPTGFSVHGVGYAS